MEALRLEVDLVREARFTSRTVPSQSKVARSTATLPSVATATAAIRQVVAAEWAETVAIRSSAIVVGAGVAPAEMAGLWYSAPAAEAAPYSTDIQLSSTATFRWAVSS